MVQIFQDSEAEKAQKDYEKRKKRFVAIAILLGVVLTIRLIVDDPEPPPPPDYSNAPIRYLPGMLDAMDDETRSNLTADQLAKFQEADRLAAEGKWGKEKEKEPAPEEYTPQEAPPEIQEDLESYKQELFVYELKRKRIEEEKRLMAMAEEKVKGTLVLFKHGGHTKAKSAKRTRSKVEINFDRGVELTVASKKVKKILEDQEDWEAPTPRGYVKLQPAKGISLTLKKQTAKRVTYENRPEYEKYL